MVHVTLNETYLILISYIIWYTQVKTYYKHTSDTFTWDNMIWNLICKKWTSSIWLFLLIIIGKTFTSFFLIKDVFFPHKGSKTSPCPIFLWDKKINFYLININTSPNMMHYKHNIRSYIIYCREQKSLLMNK